MPIPRVWIKKTRFSFILCVHGINIKLLSDVFIKKMMYTVFYMLTNNASFWVFHSKFSSASYGGSNKVILSNRSYFLDARV